MGGGYSDLNVFLLCKKNEIKNAKYKVTSTKKNFEGCSSFVVFTHTITFTPPESGLYYNIILYEGSSDNNKGEYVFGYYYPSNKNEVIEHVSSYYSVLSPNVPLVVSFKRPGNTYNCYFSRLKEARWDRAYNISEYSIKTDLSKDLLDKEFKKRSRNRKIQFTINSDNNEVMGDTQDIGESKKMFRFIFIPKGDKSVLGLNCLFEIDNKVPKSSNKNNGKIQIDPYYLSTVNGLFFDGIMVYFARENGIDNNKKDYKGTALLIEFYDSTKDKISFQRNDKKGAMWSQVNVDCNEDKKLIERLNGIDMNVKKDLSVTVILDRKSDYLGAKVTTEGFNKACKKYCHKLDETNNPVFIFARQKKQLGNFDNNFKTNIVEVYYLKVKNVEDEEPFVIVFSSSEERTPKPKKAYHFADKYGFVGWVEFRFEFNRVDEGPGKDIEIDLVKKLEEKLKKIDDSGSCIDNFGLLRWYAYRILMDKEPTEQEIKKEKAKERPKTIEPKTEKPLPIKWIIGGSVGGGVFVISSAALYGVYWYNTTIKLLT
ncbi:hypothetical protein MACK_002234 [Theileria orientalis]|uniref:Uncharacterized protein n=1 Tax=Theileria orientalis TaxID=68886 RepID=A0A976MDH3_THEOR|nr:hypothetical protein MACK_002234 [Theileria orientalis]